jgi:hypothetical protein
MMADQEKDILETKPQRRGRNVKQAQLCGAASFATRLSALQRQ